jgi:two-component system, chemotaxis family, protein-glutamate methylesterase/glutaminase
MLVSSAETARVTRDIVVVGASAGGVQALRLVVQGLPRDFAASVLVVVHIPPTGDSILPALLTKAGALTATHARNGERLERRRVYVAPPDHHLLVQPHKRLAVSRRGPRENGFRPAIDPLFRTAARSHGPRVIGVVLTGALDDGTLGLAHIKENGGVAIVQDPIEAVFPSMPRSAIDHVDVDHVVPVAAMPALLARLVGEPLEGARLMPGRTDEAADVAEVERAGLRTRRYSGPPTNIICPECGGSLWELSDHGVVHDECHVGHSFIADSLLEGKSQELESAFCGALRILEESAELRRRMASRTRNAPLPLQDLREDHRHQAEEAEARAAVLRTLLGDGPSARKLATLAEAEGAKERASSAQGNERQSPQSAAAKGTEE